MKLLVIEDDERLRGQIVRALEGNGYAVLSTGDGMEGWELGSVETLSGIILDLGLPELDGMTMLRRWREEGINTPVLVLTARSSWIERVDGMDAGADDYLTKPFRTEELLARLRALMRRTGGFAAPIMEAGRLSIDPRQMKVSKDGQPIDLAPLEYRLVMCLMTQRDRWLSGADLLELIYDHADQKDINAVEALIARTRRKLGKAEIESRRGFGYRLAGEEEGATTP